MEDELPDNGTQPGVPTQPTPVPQTDLDLKGALRAFYESMDYQVKDEDLDATAKAYAGKEADLWRNAFSSTGYQGGEAAVQKAVERYRNPYNLQKKSPGETGPGVPPAGSPVSLSSPSTEGSVAPTVEASTPLTEPIDVQVPFTAAEQQTRNFIDQTTYGSTNRDYDGEIEEAKRRHLVAVDAGAIQYQSGLIDDKQRFDRELKLNDDLRSRLKVIESKRKTGNPISSTEKVTAPESPELSTLYSDAARHFTKLMPKVDAIYSMVAQEAPGVLGTDLEQAVSDMEHIGGFFNVKKSGFGNMRAGSDMPTDRDRGLASSHYTELLEEKHPRLFELHHLGWGRTFNHRLVQAAEGNIGKLLPGFESDHSKKGMGAMSSDDLPAAFFDRLRRIPISMEPDFNPGDFGAHNNPLARVAGDLVDNYLDKSGIQLEGRERQVVRRKLEGIVRTAYRSSLAMDKARSALAESSITLPTSADADRVVAQVEEMNVAGSAQAAELNDLVEARVGGMKSEYKAAMQVFAARAKMNSNKFLEDLNAKVQGGEVSQEDAAEQYKQFISATETQASDMTREWNGRISNAVVNYNRQRAGIVEEYEVKKAEIFAGAGYDIDDEGNVVVNQEAKEMLLTIQREEMGRMSARDHREGQGEYKGLGAVEKIDRGLNVGVIQIAETVGMGLEWLGMTETGFNIARGARAAGQEAPLADTGDFDWSQIGDGDWWASKVVPMLPMLVGFGGINAAAYQAGTKMLAGAAAKTSLRSMITGSTTAAIASRFTEGMMESGSRYDKSINMGKSIAQSRADGASVFKRNMALIGLDALQVFNVARTINSSQKSISRGMQAATFGGRMTANTVVEGGEEMWQGYADYRIDNPATAFYDLSKMAEYGQSPEGMEAGVLGGMMGAGFYAGGSIGGLMVKELSKAADYEAYEQHKDAASRVNKMNTRSRQLLATLMLLNHRGTITAEEFAVATTELISASEATIAIESGEGAIKPDNPHRAEYVQLMAQSASLEQRAETEENPAAKSNLERQIRENRDKMLAIEQNNSEISSATVDGIPISNENLGAMMSNPGVAARIDASSISMEGNPLEVVETMRNAAELEPGVNDQLREEAENRISEAVAELSRDPDLAGDFSALEQRANNNFAGGQTGYAGQWGAVSEVIAEARAGTRYTMLGAMLQPSATAEGTGVDTGTAVAESTSEAADSGQEAGSTPSAGPATPRAARAAAAQDNFTGQVADEFAQIFDIPEVVMAVREKYPGLADSIDQAMSADDVSFAEQLSFLDAAMEAQDAGVVNIQQAYESVTNGRQEQEASSPAEAQTTRPVPGQEKQASGHSTQARSPKTVAAEDAAGSEDNVYSAEERASLRQNYDMTPYMKEALDNERPDLSGRLEGDMGFQDATDADVAEVKDFIADNMNAVRRRPSNPTEQHADKEIEGLATRIEEAEKAITDLMAGREPDTEAEQIIEVQAAIFGIDFVGVPNRDMAVTKMEEADRKRMALIGRLADYAMMLIEDSHSRNPSDPSKHMKRFDDFMEEMRNRMGDTEVAALFPDDVRAAFGAAVREYNLRSENPLEYYGTLSRTDATLENLFDTRIGLKRLEEVLERKFGLMSKDTDNSVYDDLAGMRSRISARGRALDEKIYGRKMGELGSSRANKESWAGRWEAETGMSVETASLYFYAKQAKDFNAHTRRMSEEKLNDEIDRHQQKRTEATEAMQQIKTAHPEYAKDPPLKRAYERARDRAKYRQQIIDRLISGDDPAFFIIEAGSGMTNDQATEIVTGLEARTIGDEKLSDALKERSVIESSIQEVSAHEDSPWRSSSLKSYEDSLSKVNEEISSLEEEGKKASDFKSIADKFYAEFRTEVIDARLDVAREAGLIDQEVYDNLMANQRPVYQRDGQGRKVKGDDGAYIVEYFEDGFKNYVPLRVNSEAYASKNAPESRPDMAGSVGSAVVQTIQGSVNFTYLQRNDPISQAVSDFHATVAQAERNKAYKKLADIAENHPDPRMWAVVPSTGMATVDATGQITGFNDLTDPTVKENSVPFLVDGKMSYLYFRPVRRVKESGLKDVARSFGIGKKVAKETYQVKHPVLNALTEEHKYKAPSGAIFEAARTYLAFRRGMTTQWNIFFGPINLIRDIQESLTNAASTGAPVNVAKLRLGIIKNMASAGWVIGKQGFSHFNAGPDKKKMYRYWSEAIDNGMPMSWGDYASTQELHNRSEETMASQGRKGLAGEGSAPAIGRAAVASARFMGDVFSRFNDIMENTTRLATYAALRDQGVKIQKAVAVSKDISLNFERHGRITPILNTGWMFANAGLQGSYRGVRNLGTKAGMLTMGSLAALGYSLSWINDMFDDDHDLKFTDFERSNYMILPSFGTQKHVTIPKTYGIARLFMNAGMYVRRAQDGRDSIHDMMTNIATDISAIIDPIGGSSSNPLSAYAPTIAQLPVQFLSNTNFMGGQMYNEHPGMETIEKTGRAPQWVIDASRQWNNATNGYAQVAPVYIWEMLRNWGGGLGSEALNIQKYNADPAADDWMNATPVLRRLMVDASKRERKAVNELYSQTRRSRYNQPTEEERRLAQVGYDIIVKENRRRRAAGLDPLVKNRSLSFLKSQYKKKFGLNLSTGRSQDLGEYTGDPKDE